MAVKPIRLVTKDITPQPANLILLDDGVSMGKATLESSVAAIADPLVAEAIDDLGLGTAAQQDVEAFASASQGGKADTAVQPDDLGAVATSNDYDDLSNKPTLGTAAATDATDYATASQGSKADTAMQPANSLSDVASVADARKNITVPVYVADRTAAKALDATKDAVLIITSEGGRNGTFVFDLSDVSAMVTADPLEGVYVAPSSDTTGTSGARVRQYGGFLNVQWFGAHPTASAATNKAAINAAISLMAALGGGTVFIPAGAYDVEPGIAITSNAGIELAGEDRTSAILKPSTATGDFATLSGWNSVIRDLSIRSTERREGGISVILSGVGTKAYNLILNGQYTAIQMSGVKSHIVGVDILNTVNFGIEVLGGDTSQVIHRTIMGAQSAPYPVAGILIRHSSALRISDSDFINAGYALYIRPNTGQGVYSLKVVNSHFDSSANGLRIDPVNGGNVARLDFANCWFGGNSNSGVLIRNLGTGIVQGIDFHSCNAHLNASAGYEFTNCKGWNIIGGRVSTNAWGVYVNADCADFGITGALIGRSDGGGGNTSGGIFINTDADNYVISSCRIVGNSGLAISNHTSSPTKIVRDCVGYVNDNYGTASVELVDGVADIAHGLVGAPKFAVVEAINVGSVEASIEALSSTNISVRLRDTTTDADAADGTYSIAWSARL